MFVVMDEKYMVVDDVLLAVGDSANCDGGGCLYYRLVIVVVVIDSGGEVAAMVTIVV